MSPLWMLGRESAMTPAKIQSGVMPPHSKVEAPQPWRTYHPPFAQWRGPPTVSALGGRGKWFRDGHPFMMSGSEEARRRVTAKVSGGREGSHTISGESR